MRLRLHLSEGTSEWESNLALFRVGRADTCALRFDGEAAKYSSWEHAEFRLDDQGRAYVSDLGSSNGTYVDGVRITDATRLRNGMSVQIGTKGPRLDVLDLGPPAVQPTPVSESPVDSDRPPKAGWRDWALAGALGAAMLAVVGFLFLRGGSAPEPRQVVQADGDGKNGQPEGDGDDRPIPPTTPDDGGSPNRADPELTDEDSETNEEKTSTSPEASAPVEPWKAAKEAALPAYRLIAVEDPQSQTTWPLAGAVIVGPQALLTTADVGIELQKLRAREMKVKILRDSQDAGVLADQIRIHAAFQKAGPDEQLYFDLAIVSTGERLTGAATLATAAELATIERGQPLACAATDHSGEPIDRFQRLRAEWQTGKVFAVTRLSSEAGAPRLLHLRGAFSDKSSGSPIFDDHGQLVAVYCEAAPEEKGASAARALHYAKLIEPRLIELGLSQSDNSVWVAPVVPPEPPSKEEPAK